MHKESWEAQINANVTEGQGQVLPQASSRLSCVVNSFMACELSSSTVKKSHKLRYVERGGGHLADLSVLTTC